MPPCIDTDKLGAGMHLDCRFGEIMRDGVVVTFVLDVIVDVHAGIENINVLIWGVSAGVIPRVFAAE